MGIFWGWGKIGMMGGNLSKIFWGPWIKLDKYNLIHNDKDECDFRRNTKITIKNSGIRK